MEENIIYRNCECWMFWRMHFPTLCAFGSMYTIQDLTLNMSSYLGPWRGDTRAFNDVFCPFFISKAVQMKSTLISEKDYHKCYTLLLALHKCCSGQAALRGIALSCCRGGIISSGYLNCSFCVPVLSLKGCTSSQNAAPKLDKSLKTWAVMQFLRWA